VRFIIDNTNDKCFRSRNGIIIPYIKIDFDELLIEEIVIGPKIVDEIAEDGLRQLCQKYYLESINISKSELKIR